MSRRWITGARALVFVAVAVAVAGAIAPVSASAPIEGTWLTEEGDARVRIEPCDEHLCGRIVWLRDRNDDGSPLRDVNNPDPELRDRLLHGARILTELSAAPDEDGVYRGGSIYDPDSGKTYRCKAELLAGGRLKFRGFVGISLLGRTTHWTRAEPANGR